MMLSFVSKHLLKDVRGMCAGSTRIRRLHVLRIALLDNRSFEAARARGLMLACPSFRSLLMRSRAVFDRSIQVKGCKMRLGWSCGHSSTYGVLSARSSC